MVILLVEDHEDTRDVLGRLLVRAGHIVFTAGTVETAISMLRSVRIDVLLSDIGLPDGTGYKIAAEAKRRFADIKAIAVTAWTRDEDREQGLLAGFDEYFSKPFDFGRLKQAIESAGAI